ncbi:MAG TPA: hypothetical protein EYQ08_08410 [Planctomycetes bacterium]|nr:hypothetical protein [Planctomycetota bacterium]HIK82854.1 hypothetical protein [Planctomycetota bacterium]
MIPSSTGWKSSTRPVPSTPSALPVPSTPSALPVPSTPSALPESSAPAARSSFFSSGPPSPTPPIPSTPLVVMGKPLFPSRLNRSENRIPQFPAPWKTPIDGLLIIKSVFLEGILRLFLKKVQIHRPAAIRRQGPTVPIQCDITVSRL